MACELHTIEQVLEALGGIKGVAEITHRATSAVPNWKLRGAFPSNTYAKMQAALKAKGYSAPDALWRRMAEPGQPDEMPVEANAS